MRRITSAIAIAALLTIGPIHAFEAAGADILGLRLGMSGSDVIARLALQGYTAHGTPEAITAVTRDGQLRAVLSPDQGVTEITYVFYARGMGGPDKIQDSIMTRFGDPNQAKPPAWCRAVGQDGICPPDQASLTFLSDSLTLRLAVGQTKAP
jgi:hypothetical protein